jgi:hypothetical protein
VKPIAVFAIGAGFGAACASLARRLRLRCTLRGRHNPYRLRLGSLGFGLSAFGCLDCPKRGATYSDMGFDEEDDQVSPRARGAGGATW